MRGFATSEIALGETSQFPSLVTPPPNCRSPRILADGFRDPLNFRFTFSVLCFMVRFSYPLFVFQLAFRSVRWLFRPEIVVSVAPSLCAEPLSSRAALFVRVNLNSERNHIRNKALKSLPNCQFLYRLQQIPLTSSLHLWRYNPFLALTSSKDASILLCPRLISSNLKDL